MGRMIRTTVIGLLDQGITFEDIQAFVHDRLAQKAFTGFKTVLGVSTAEDGEERYHIKFSKLFETDQLDHRWHLGISNEFRDAGYGDVAWKFTEVDSEDPEGENTTVSIHPGLFKACSEEDECGLGPQSSLEPGDLQEFGQEFQEIDK